jgi:DedD protein
LSKAIQHQVAKNNVAAPEVAKSHLSSFSTKPVEKNRPEALSTSAVISNHSAVPPSQTGNLIQRVVIREKVKVVKATEAPSTTSNPFIHETSKPAAAVAVVDKTAPANNDTANASPSLPSAFPVTPVITTALEAKDEIEKAQRIAMDSAQAVAPVAASEKVKINHDQNVLVVDSEGSITQVPEESVQAVTAALTPDKAAIAASIRTASVKTPANPSKTITKKTTVATAMHIPASVPAADMSENLSNLKKTAWVVQMGSFRNKGNAIRLTNALRAKGYKAFTYETKSNGQTRVYVGPEFKQASASVLVNRIQEEIDMQGVIVAYNPLEL